MAGPLNLTGQNIQDTYQRVLQTDGVSIYDGTGSLFSLPSAFPYTGSAQITGSLSVTGSLIASSFTGSLQGTASWANNAISASYALNAVSSSFASTASYINTTSTNAFVQSGNSFGATALLGTNDNQSLAFETSGSVRVFVSSSGNVGIGTSTPAQKLTVSGAIYSNNAFVSTAVWPQTIGFNTVGSLTAGVGIHTNTWRGTIAFPQPSFVANAYTSSVTNYVLTGTRPSTPTFSQFQLYVKTDNTSVIDLSGGGPILDIANNGTVYSRFDGTNFSIGASSALARLYAKGTGTTSATTAFRVDNANASASLVVLDNGNVLINTTTDTGFKLDVNGTARVTGNITGNAAITAATQITAGLINEAGARYIINGSSVGRNWQIANNWNVGGGFEITPSTAAGGSTFTTPSFVIAGATGNVGIGTNAPGARLDVSGSARITNGLTVTGSISTSTNTTGQSTLGTGLIVNNTAGSSTINDFQVKSQLYNAIYVSSSADSIALMSSPNGKLGFFGATPTTQSAGWSVANYLVSKSFDANTVTLEQLADVVGTILTELKNKGLLG
jgi:hypothetical protein